jgi:hypothetical protein
MQTFSAFFGYFNLDYLKGFPSEWSRIVNVKGGGK